VEFILGCTRGSGMTLLCVFACATIRVGGCARVIRRHGAGRLDPGPLCANRHGGPDRACRKKRHFDCRIRKGKAGRRRAAFCRPQQKLHDCASRPVMMTSFAFILGLLPLVIVTGVAQTARRDVGTPVFGGMILASFIGIFAIPSLYVTFQAVRERLRPAAREQLPQRQRSQPSCHCYRARRVFPPQYRLQTVADGAGK
jgi:hypothetical protein